MIIIVLIIAPILYTNYREYRGIIIVVSIFVIIVVPLFLVTCCDRVSLRPKYQGGSPFFHPEKHQC